MFKITTTQHTHIGRRIGLISCSRRRVARVSVVVGTCVVGIIILASILHVRRKNGSYTVRRRLLTSIILSVVLRYKIPQDDASHRFSRSLHLGVQDELFLRNGINVEYVSVKGTD